MEFLLLGYEKKRTVEDLWEDIQEWLNNVLERKDVDTESAAMMKRSVKTMKQRNSSRKSKITFQGQKSKSSYESKNLLDRKFVKHLQKSLKKEQELETNNRIQLRQAEELQREKLLILNGKMAIENTPAELLNHPVFKISLETNKTLEQKRRLAEEIINMSFSRMNTRMLRRLARENKRRAPHQTELVLDRNEILRARRLKKIKEDLDRGNILTRDDYERIWYESPQVKRFKQLETVCELYEQADILVGRFKRIPSFSEISKSGLNSFTKTEENL